MNRDSFFKEENLRSTSLGRLPQDWKIISLKEIAKTCSGGTPSRARKEYYGGKIPWVKSGELNDAIIYSSEERITEDGLRHSSAKLLPKGTLLVAMYGATVGKTGILGIEAATNQAICAISASREELDLNYLQQQIIHKRDDLISAAAGGAQPNISQGIIRSIRFPLPPIREQRRIADILSTVDQCNQKVSEIVAKSELLRTGIMRGLLTNGLEHKEFQHTEFGRIPKEWKLVRLSELISFGPQNGVYKEAKYYGEGVLIIRIENFGFGTLRKELALKRIRLTNEELSTYSIKAGDIILNRVNSIEFVGKSILISTVREPMVFESNMMRFSIRKNEANPEFIVRYLNSDLALRYIRSKAKRAVHQASINQQDVRSIPIYLPPIDEQRRIASDIAIAERKLELERDEKTKLERLKRGLMPLLLTGRIRS